MRSFLRVVLASGLLTPALAQTPSFTAASSFPAGTLPTSVAVGDFNLDGKPDLAVTNQNGVSILINSGNGAFQAPVSYTVGGNPQAVAVGDFNADGKLDLAVVNEGSGTVSILLGNGNGTFQGAVSYPAGTIPRFVVVADINGDGKPDLAVADSGTATGSGVSVLLGNGNGTFQPAMFTAGGSSALSLTVGDFNGDTKADVAIANSGSDNISVLLGNGNGTFATAVNYSLDQPGLSISPTSVVTADFNHDGKLDLAATTPSGKNFAVLLGVGDGTFRTAVHYPLDDPNFSNNLNRLATADLNGDGNPDLIIANVSANHVTVLLGAGDGTFPTIKSYAAGPEPNSVAIADFNGDGRPDIAASGNAQNGVVTVLLGAGGGLFEAAPLARASSIPSSFAVGDLNGDGKLDLITASRLTPIGSGLGSGVAMLGNGDGTFQAPANWSTTSVNAVALGDLNGDGKLDLVATSSSPGNGNIAIYLGKGDGTFQSAVTVSAGTTPQAIAIADLNGDGKADLIVSNHNSANISVLLGNGNGTFQTAVNYNTPTTGTPDAIAVGDFNGDRKLDVAVANSAGTISTVVILLGNGNGTLQTALAIPATFHNAALAMVAADFNNDGRSDLAVTDGTNLSILLAAGSGGFLTPVTSPFASAVSIVTGDFNGDGKADLAVTSRDGVSVFAGNGDGSFQAAVSYDPFLGGPVVVGDFDGDGRPDLITADSTADSTGTDTVAILMNSTIVPIPVTIASSPTGLQASVDSGSPCTTPCNLTLNWGTRHNLSVSAYQPVAPVGTRYHFDHWSDSGAIAHTVIIPRIAATYTATFKTQYSLTTAVSPTGAGTVSIPPNALDVGGFADTGTVVPITAVANSGFAFVNWTGPVASTTNASTTVTMTAPQTVTANFITAQTSGLQFIPVTPCRVIDTRGPAGPFGGPAVGAGSIRSVTIPQSMCNIPAGALAYSLNVTVVPIVTLTYLSIWPAGQPQPVVSTLNSFDGSIVANAAIVPAGSQGAISLFASDATQVIIDINGYFAPAGAGSSLSFYSVAPCRVVDTRNAAGPLGGPVMTAGSTRSFPFRSSSCATLTTAQAYSLNITVVPRRSLSYLTSWPSGQTQPVVSTLNSPNGLIVANAAIVPAGANGAISIFVTDDTDVIIDINGYFAPPGSPAAQSLYTVTPCRVADTRGGFSAPFGAPSLGANGSRSFPIPAGVCNGIPAAAQAYSLNVTVVPSGPLGYLTAWPTGQTQPVVSTLNSPAGKVVANAAIVPAGTAGAVTVFVTDPTNLILDINAYFAP
ncbi:MAG TPA: FG-GAP-like repeat-containing protein [Bryobacteraceae bacterium]|nr:FG-GAP-like repeat-containing protein [Bryobacteraceae bacterium]